VVKQFELLLVMHHTDFLFVRRSREPSAHALVARETT
jgi:hypothetical protein